MLVRHLELTTTAPPTVSARSLTDLLARLQSLDVPCELRHSRCRDSARDRYVVERLREVGQGRGDNPFRFAGAERVPTVRLRG